MLYKHYDRVLVSAPYDASATSIVLVPGGGNRLPDTPFFASWYATDYPNATDDPNGEVIFVSSKTGDTLEVVRGQGGTRASLKNDAEKTYFIVGRLWPDNCPRFISIKLFNPDNGLFYPVSVKTKDDSAVVTIADEGEL